MSFEVDYLKEKFSHEFEVCWIYGSRAIALETDQSDLDVLVYDSRIKEPFRDQCKIDGIPTSINFFGLDFIQNNSTIRNNGLYFPTRFLSPIKLVFEKGELSADIEKRSFQVILEFLVPFLRNAEEKWKLANAERVLSLYYLFKIRMNYCYLVYFTSWLESVQFEKFWERKLRFVDNVLTTFNPEFSAMNSDKLLIEFQLLSANFWKFAYSFRNNDENHIHEYHTKQFKKIDSLDSKRVKLAMEFLKSKSHPFELLQSPL